MADPKYANLPGIVSIQSSACFPEPTPNQGTCRQAHDQPDVFETSDLPESEQHLGDDGGVIGMGQDETSDAVEVLHISANEAFGRFRGKTVDAKGVDFSDRLKAGARKKGYGCWSGEYEICAPGEEETPMQKYHRLNCEVRELMEAVEDAKRAEKGKGKGGAGGDAK